MIVADHGGTAERETAAGGEALGQQPEPDQIRPIQPIGGSAPPRQKQLPWLRGVLVTLIAGPVLLVGGLIAASAMLSMVIAGWIPSNWFSGSLADFALGTGVRGDAANYVRFMVGAGPATLAWAVIRWAWTPLP